MRPHGGGGRGSRERRMRPGAGFSALAWSPCARTERVEESGDKPEAREGAGRRRGGRERVLPSGPAPPSRRRGVLAAGPPNPRRAGPCDWQRRAEGGGEPGSLTLPSSESFPAGAAGAASALGAAGVSLLRGCCRALSRGRRWRRQQQRGREATT